LTAAGTTNASGPQANDQVGRSHLNPFDLIRAKSTAFGAICFKALRKQEMH
jgi:hypothetical protein